MIRRLILFGPKRNVETLFAGTRPQVELWECPLCRQRTPVMWRFQGVVGLAIHFTYGSPCPQREAVVGGG